MATKLYKVYQASDYDGLDLSKFTSNVRWNNDNTEFIVEFKEQPINETGVLTHEQAVQIVSQLNWILDIDI
jgi:hypothetical protein